MKIKSYSSIWTAKGMLHAIGDMSLPRSVEFSAIAWFVSSFLIVVIFGNAFPLVLLPDSIRYICVPIGITILMNKRTFDGKNPIMYIFTVIKYLFRPKRTYMCLPIQKPKKYKYKNEITIVRGEL